MIVAYGAEPDGEGTPTVWRYEWPEGEHMSTRVQPVAVMRKTDIPARDREGVWRALVRGLNAGNFVSRM